MGMKLIEFFEQGTVVDLRKLARCPLMDTERQRCILVEVYKCLNHISPPYLHDMFNVKDFPYGLRNDSIVALLRYNYIKYVKYSILYDGATLLMHNLLVTLKECYRHGAVLHVHVWYVNHVV